jgi:hypothetical protein
MRSLGATVCALGGLWLASVADAQQTDLGDAPDLDFLEYLGTWQAEDDEWLAIEQWHNNRGRDSDRAREDGEVAEPEPQRNDDEDE